MAGRSYESSGWGRDVAVWLEKGGKLRVYAPIGEPFEHRYDTWAVLYVEDDEPALEAALRRVWTGAELDAFRAQMEADG